MNSFQNHKDKRQGIQALDFLSPDIGLPNKEAREVIFNWLSGYDLVDAPKEEMDRYLKESLLRFLYTLMIIPVGSGRLLEIGSNPYFMSMVIRKFTDYKLYCSNFFGPELPDKGVQYRINKKGEKIEFKFYYFNIEGDDIPFDTGYFDVILFCEVIEHLVRDPLKALLNIKRSLKTNGYLIITTPNVARLENVAKLIVGENIYNFYSGYGLYGRHNREYNKHELSLLLNQLGFEIEILFSSDVSDNISDQICDVSKFMHLIEYRKADLGQYIFCRAKNVGKADRKRPEWLYQNYSPEDMLGLDQ